MDNASPGQPLAAAGCDGGAPAVRWIREERPGLSYARNTGVNAAAAAVIAFADDDMELRPDWLEHLVRPLLRGESAVVTGLTVPLKMETEAERLFEAYGGHGYPPERRLYGIDWLRRFRFRLPLWEAGGLGNCAASRSVLAGAGPFEEALGAGTPAGSWEDLDMVYRLLSAGHRILHEPRAVALHAHREDVAGLRRQLCAYRRGEVCFCLLTFARRRDWRALSHLLFWIPYWRAALLAGEARRRLQGKRQFRFDLMASEIWAYLTAPLALAASLARKRQLAQNPSQR